MHEWKYNLFDRPQIVANELGELFLDKRESTENLITWIFDEGSFVPSAKITKDDTYSIISDYIGKPIAAYNGVGNLVWDVEYDIYGNIRSQSKGDKDFIPFRNQGQYEDAEVNLFYNRFRYYSAESGMYISQDPIRLKSGEINLYCYVYDSNNSVDVFGLDLIVVIGEGQSAIENYASKMRELFPEHEWKTIKNDWMSIVKKSGANVIGITAEEYERKTNQGNADWIVEQHNKGAKFADIGFDEAANRSSFYNTELETIEKIGAKKFRGSTKWIKWARENSPKSSRPPSKILCR